MRIATTKLLTMGFLEFFIFLCVVPVVSRQENDTSQNDTVDEHPKERFSCVIDNFIFQSTYSISIADSWSNPRYVGFLEFFIFLCVVPVVSRQENDTSQNDTVDEHPKERFSCVIDNFIFQSTYSISIADSWSNPRYEWKSDEWNCIENKSCQVKGKYNNCLQQLCICSVKGNTCQCIYIKCKVKLLENKSKVTYCKYAMENVQSSNDDKKIEIIETLTTAEIASQRGKIPNNDVCSFSVMKSGVHSRHNLGLEKLDVLTVVIKKVSALAANGKTKKFFDIVDKCSDDPKCRVFVNRRMARIFLCVFSHNDSTCVSLKCEENTYRSDNNRLNLGENSNSENGKSLQTIWNQWKKEIILVSSGVVLLSGIFGFLFGVCFSFYRKNKSIKRYTERKCTYSINSELYEQISDKSSIIQGNTQTIPEQNISNTTKAVNPCDPPICNHESETNTNTEFEYSHVYNILEPNYGTRCTSQSSNLSKVESVYSLPRCLSLEILPEKSLKQRSSSMLSI